MPIDFLAIAPEIALAVTALVVLAADLSLRGSAKQLVNPLAAIGTLVALYFVARLWGDERTTFAGTFVIDSFALAFKALFLLVLLAVLGLLLVMVLSGFVLQFLGLTWMSTTAVVTGLPSTFRGQTPTWDLVRMFIVFSALTAAAIATSFWVFRERDL